MTSLRFSMYSIMSPTNRENFTSFPIYIPFISFSSLITVAKTSEPMLNKSGTSGYSCLIPDLREKRIQNIFKVSALDFLRGLCQVEKFPFCF